jgi:hypothetical protein
MTALEKQQHQRLCEIGRDLEDAYFSGRLDFDAFKTLLRRAIDGVGAAITPAAMAGSPG